MWLFTLINHVRVFLKEYLLEPAAELQAYQHYLTELRVLSKIPVQPRYNRGQTFDVRSLPF